MGAIEPAADEVLLLLDFLSAQGWDIGMGGVVVHPTGNLTFFVHGPSADLVAAIDGHGLSLPYSVEQTDRHGVIYPPV